MLGKQNAFWDMHDRLFANQQALEREDLQKYARILKLDVDVFNKCLDGGEVANKVASDLADAERLGLTGTPVFLIGELRENSKLHVTHRIDGSQPFALFKETIEKVLMGDSAVNKH